MLPQQLNFERQALVLILGPAPAVKDPSTVILQERKHLVLVGNRRAAIAWSAYPRNAIVTDSRGSGVKGLASGHGPNGQPVLSQFDSRSSWRRRASCGS